MFMFPRQSHCVKLINEFVRVCDLFWCAWVQEFLFVNVLSILDSTGAKVRVVAFLAVF